VGQLADWLTGVPVSMVQDGLYTANWVLPVSQPAIPHGFVQVQQGRVTQIGMQNDLGTKHGLPIKAHADLLTPGLINTHTHLELTYDQPIPAPQGMGPWLQQVVALSRQNNEADQTRRIQLGIRQLLTSGTTFCHDISRRGASVPWLAQAGLGGQVALEFFHPSGEHFNPQPLQALWQTLTPAPRQQLGLSPHSLYNVHPSVWLPAIKAVNPAFIHTHLAESPDEMAWLKGDTGHGIDRLHQQVLGKAFGCAYPSHSVATYLQASSLASLSQRLPIRFAHGTFCTPSDAEALIKAGWQVLHCPRSNLYLTGQTTSAHLWPVLPLGTDSTLSCPDLDVRQEARVAKALHHWTASQALKAITWDAAQALGLDQGCLSPGKRADLVLWHCPEITLNPDDAWLNNSTVQQVVLA
jgi:aminodeoxyfutalosine deaminase